MKKHLIREEIEAETSLLKGSLFAITAFFFMAVFGVITKAASSEGGEIWVSFITYLIGTLISIIFILPSGVDYIKTQKLKFHIGRALFGLTASFLYMIAMQYIPIVNATLLFNTAPIFIPILAPFLLKMPTERSTWLAVALGFVGIVIIIRPNAQIFEQIGDLIGLASGISLAIAYLLIKKLSSTDPLRRIVFYYFFISMCVQVPFLFFAGSPPSMHNCVLSALAGCALAFAQFSLVQGYKYDDPSKIGVYQYTSVVFVGIIDWAIWGQIPPVSDLVGVVLVVLAALIIIRKTIQAKKLPGINVHG